jgi:DNA repair protein RadD
MINLRPYQLEGVENIRSAYLSGRRAPLYVLPTGGGKTVLFSYIAQQTVNNDKKVLILVHRIELLRQAQASIIALTGLPCGIINSKFTPNLHAPIQVASVQTLVSRMDFIQRYFQPNLIVIDECHHCTAGTYRKIIDFNPSSFLLGVTATPCRTDGAGLGANSGGYFDELILGPDAAWLMDEGYLVRPKIYGSKTRIDFSDVDMIAGDYQKKQMQKKLDKPTITGDAVEHYQKISDGQPSIVFCVSVEHAENVAAQFSDAGYRAFSVDGSLEDEIRNERLTGLANGKSQIITSCELISEGTDIPNVVTAIELRPTASLGLNIQQRGRVLRPVYAKGLFDLNTRQGRLDAIAASNKPCAYILDHVGNTYNHGFPDDSRNWTLDGSKKNNKKNILENQEKINLKIRQCDACYSVHVWNIICPDCGHIYQVNQTEIKQVEGELRELTNADREAIKQEKRVEIAKAKNFNDLLKIEKERSYKPGWAKHVWMARGKKEFKL